MSLTRGTKFSCPECQVTYKNDIVGYIDDTNINLTYQHVASSPVQMTSELENAASIWSQLLHATGGELSLPKCYFYITNWKWKNGIATASPICAKEVASHPSLTKCQLKQHRESERYRGVRLSPSGQVLDEFKYRLEQTTILASCIQESHLSRYEACILYYKIWIPQINYCLPIIWFSRKQCQKLQSKILQAILPKMGYNRTTPRSLIHDPTDRGGIGIPTLYHLQGITHIKEALTRLRKNDDVGKLLMISIKYLQLECGLKESVFTGYFVGSLYVEKTWCSSLWMFLSEIQSEIQIPNYGKYEIQRENDKFIMSEMCEDYYGASLKKLNSFRVWLEVLTLADIVDYKGGIICQWAWEGSHKSTSQIYWPNQALPAESSWKLWRTALSKNFNMIKGKLQLPLGKWVNRKRHIVHHYLLSHDGTTILQQGNPAIE